MELNTNKNLDVHFYFKQFEFQIKILCSSFETTHKINNNEITVRRGSDGRFISKDEADQLKKDEKVVRNAIDRYKGGENIDTILQDKRLESHQVEKIRKKELDIKNISSLEEVLEGSDPERKKLINFLMEDYQFYKDNPKKQNLLLESFDRGYNETPRILQQSISASADIGKILLEAHRKHEEALNDLKSIEDDNKFYELLGRSAGYGVDLSITAVFALGLPNVYALAKGRELQVFLMGGMNARLIKKEVQVVKDTVLDNPDLRIYSSIPFSFLIGSGLAGHFINAGESKPEIDKTDIKFLLENSQIVMDKLDIENVKTVEDLEGQIVSAVSDLDPSSQERLGKMMSQF